MLTVDCGWTSGQYEEWLTYTLTNTLLSGRDG
jgi:hypothetical protein